MAIQTMYVLEAPAVSGSSLFPMARREKEEGGGGNAGSERRREVIRQKREKRSIAPQVLGFFGGSVKGSRSRRGKEQYFFLMALF